MRSLKTLLLRGAALALLLAVMGAQACGDDDDGGNGGSPAPTETSEPTPSPQWKEYTDSATGVLFPVPGDVTAIESSTPLTLESGEEVTTRILGFSNASGIIAFTYAVTPNPEGKSLADWIAAYPKITSESTEVTIGGLPGVRYEEVNPGDTNLTVYWSDDENVYGMQGQTSDLQDMQQITEEDFERIVDGIVMP